jgi:hypothetical protein
MRAEQIKLRRVRLAGDSSTFRVPAANLGRSELLLGRVAHQEVVQPTPGADRQQTPAPGT